MSKRVRGCESPRTPILLVALEDCVKVCMGHSHRAKCGGSGGSNAPSPSVVGGSARIIEYSTQYVCAVSRVTENKKSRLFAKIQRARSRWSCLCAEVFRAQRVRVVAAAYDRSRPCRTKSSLTRIFRGCNSSQGCKLGLLLRGFTPHSFPSLIIWLLSFGRRLQCRTVCTVTPVSPRR